MKKNNQILEGILNSGFISGFSTFILSYIIIYYWKTDGFNYLEIGFMSILSGVFFFISIILSNIYFLNKGIRNARKSNSADIKRIFQIFLSLIIGMLTFLIFDTIIFLVDDSIPRNYANILKDIAERNGDILLRLDDFAKLPFGLQNFILTFIFGLIGTLISLLFIKRNGIIINNNKNHF